MDSAHGLGNEADGLLCFRVSISPCWRRGRPYEPYIAEPDLTRAPGCCNNSLELHLPLQTLDPRNCSRIQGAVTLMSITVPRVHSEMYM